MPPPVRVDLTSPERPYFIGPNDQISIEVFGISDLNRVLRIDSNGQISFPLIGLLRASGTTPAELALTIQRGLRANHIRNPQVTVNLVQPVGQTVTVDGEVDEPGVYPIVGRMTLMRAVASAQGVTEFARLSHVMVFRSVEGRQMAALYDLRSIRRGFYDDPEIYANDVVVVGTSQSRRLFRDILQGSGLLTAPIIALLQRTP